MLQLRVPRDLKQLCASALLVGLVASPAVAQPPPAAADSATQRETNFKAGFLNGCIKTKQQRGVDERYVRAYCLCAMLEFRAATGFDMKIFDQTVERWTPILAAAAANHDRWAEAQPV